VRWKKAHGLILTLNGILNELVSQIRDFILSDIIQYLRDLQITVEEYFITVVGFTGDYGTIYVPFHRTTIITETV
jgi:hypothetical protein